MKITDKMIDKFVETIAEKSKEYNNGEVSYPYIAGALQCELKWALSGKMQREIVEKNILEAIAVEGEL